LCKHFGIEPRPPVNPRPEVRRIVERDIHDLGRHGLTVVENVGATLEGEVGDCTECRRCLKACNEDALEIVVSGGRVFVKINTEKCMGTACRRCERACKGRLLKIDALMVMSRGAA